MSVLESVVSTLPSQTASFGEIKKAWQKKGVIRASDNFVCLNQALEATIVDTLSDRLLGDVLFKVAKNLGYEPSILSAKVLRCSAVPWYPTVYPCLVSRISCSQRDECLYVHPDVAYGYILASRLLRTAEVWREQIVDLVFASLIPHQAARLDFDLDSSSLLYKHLSGYETAIIESHHCRFLYLADDLGSCNILLDLQNQVFGVDPCLIDSEIVGSSLNLDGFFCKLKFFSDRLYLPLWLLDYSINISAKQKADSVVSILSVLRDFLQATNFVEKIAGSSRSAKFAVLEYLGELGYTSPFGS